MTELHRYSSIVDDYRESNRSSPFYTHLSMVSEGIVAVGWIVEKRPPDFVSEILGGAQYWGNKVLKEYKDKSVLSCFHSGGVGLQRQGQIAHGLHSSILQNPQFPDCLLEGTFCDRSCLEQQRRHRCGRSTQADTSWSRSAENKRTSLCSSSTPSAASFAQL